MTELLNAAKKVRRRLLHWLWRLRCVIRPDEIPVFSLPNSNMCIGYPIRSIVGRELFLGQFEPAELSFVRRTVPPGGVFLDIGANAGIFTVTAAELVGNMGHVYAFEPGTAEKDLLSLNIKRNKLENVTTVNCAVSNRSGDAEFAVSYDGAMNSLRKTDHPGQQIKEWRTVKTTTVDEFVLERSIPKVDFMKIDVEGAEKFVFEGARKLLVSSKNLTILFEASDLNAAAFGYTVKDFLSELRSGGLNLYYLDRDGSLIPVIGDDVRFGNEIYNFVAKL